MFKKKKKKITCGVWKVPLSSSIQQADFISDFSLLCRTISEYNVTILITISTLPGSRTFEAFRFVVSFLYYQVSFLTEIINSSSP